MVNYNKYPYKWVTTGWSLMAALMILCAILLIWAYSPGKEKIDPIKEKQWMEIARFTGQDNKETDYFISTSNRLRVSYSINCKRCYFPYYSVYMIPEWGDLGDFVTHFDLDVIGNDSTIIRTGPDKYYFMINAANLDRWEIVVEEER